MSETETKTVGVKRKDGKFFQVSNTIIDDWGPVIGSDGVSIYCLLERKSNSETGTAWMGHDWIAERLCISTDTVGVVLGDLEELGLVTVERQRDPATGQIKRSLYTVVEPVPACNIKPEDAPRAKRIEARKAKRTAIQSVQISKAHTVPFSKGNTELSSKPIPNGSVGPDLTIRQYKDSVSSDKDSILLDKDSKGEAAKAAASPPAPPPAPAIPSKPVVTKGKTAKTSPQPTQRTTSGQPKRTPDEVALCEELVDGLSEASGMLRQTNRSALYTAGWLLVNLLGAGIRPSKGHILKAFGETDPGPGHWWWYRDDQRVKMDRAKGLPDPIPKPHQIAEMYTVSLRPTLAVVNGKGNGNGNRSRGTPGANGDPSIDYLAIALEQETRRTSGRTIEGRFVNG